MLIVPTSYSQNARLVVKGDTLYLLPVEALRAANVLFVERDHFEAQTKALRAQISGLNDLVGNYKEQTLQADSAIKSYKKAYETEAQALDVANQMNKDLVKRTRRSKLLTEIMASSLAASLIYILLTVLL